MNTLFNSILSEQLSSVDFVQDYVQLRFDGPVLTYYTWPTVNIQNNKFDINDTGYRDALCSIITHKVEDVEFLENTSLTLLFDSGLKINLELIRNDSNYNLPEFIYFNDQQGEWFVLN